MLKALANGLCLEASWQGVKLPSKGKSLAHRNGWVLLNPLIFKQHFHIIRGLEGGTEQGL
jgi:hypothetical protein